MNANQSINANQSHTPNPANPAPHGVPRHSGALADVARSLDKPVPAGSETLLAGPPPESWGGMSGGASGGMSGGISSSEMHDPFDPEEIARVRAARATSAGH